MPRTVARENTRDRILSLVAERGPIGATALARLLGTAPAGVRRHLANLEAAGQIALFDARQPGAGHRGRPTNLYVATAAGPRARGDSNGDVAREALGFLRSAVGEAGVAEFATQREHTLVARYGDAVNASGGATLERADALADALTEDGYAASVRTVGRTSVVQLCQGHCPILDAARAAPELCAAETRAFSTLLGTHVQRIATIANGSFACTLSIPEGVEAGGQARSATDRLGGANTLSAPTKGQR